LEAADVAAQVDVKPARETPQIADDGVGDNYDFGSFDRQEYATMASRWVSNRVESC